MDIAWLLRCIAWRFRVLRAKRYITFSICTCKDNFELSMSPGLRAR